jgi:hypothetical protein
LLVVQPLNRECAECAISMWQFDDEILNKDDATRRLSPVHYGEA